MVLTQKLLENLVLRHKISYNINIYLWQWYFIYTIFIQDNYVQYQLGHIVYYLLSLCQNQIEKCGIAVWMWGRRQFDEQI